MSDYKKVTPVGGIEADDYPDVHLDVCGVKLDLPNLRGSRLPLEIVEAVLLIRSNEQLDEETTSRVMSIFLAYFQRKRPDFWHALSRSDNPLGYLTGTIQAWAEQSGLDPKLSSSASSGSHTGAR